MLCIGMRHLCKTRGTGLWNAGSGMVRLSRGRYGVVLERGLERQKTDIRSSSSSKERRLAQTTLTGAAPTRNMNLTPFHSTARPVRGAARDPRPGGRGGALRLTAWPGSP
jgi:hypothetical protein